MNDRPEVIVMVTTLEVGDDPPITIYHVALENKTGIWSETFGCREQLAAFIRGIKATAAMLGATFREPVIPGDPNG
ncbi:MAG: hypothetical protein HY340_03515 [Candidatus Kerfeldbacteria bacterium]|nr:hypothetical protein [Candidatus Kerfeldbacteria bacterium]